MIGSNAFAHVEVEGEAALWDWLEAHHRQREAVWLVTWKKHAGTRYLSTGQVLDALLADGWIDGIRRKLDADRAMQLIAPRAMHVWAATYQDRAARLIGEGRMRPAGLAVIEAAKAAGLWDAGAHVDALEVPDDLAAALGDLARFAAMAPSYRRNLLRWIAQAKTAPTRARRVAEVAARTAAGEKVPQF